MEEEQIPKPRAGCCFIFNEDEADIEFEKDLKLAYQNWWNDCKNTMRWALLREEIINPSIWSHWATTSAERSDTFHGVNFAEGSKLRGKAQRWVKYFRLQKSLQKKRARRAQTTAENSMEVDVGRAGNSVTPGTPSNEINLGYNNTGVELVEDSSLSETTSSSLGSQP